VRRHGREASGVAATVGVPGGAQPEGRLSPPVGRGTGRYSGRRGADKDRAVTSENQIIEFLTQRRGRLFCADCIPLELRWPNPKDINGAMHAIGTAKGFRWASGTCSRCGGECEEIKAG
jgi:hypothetical protein